MVLFSLGVKSKRYLQRFYPAKSVFKPHLPPPTPPLNTNVKLKRLSKKYLDLNSKILLTV
jgi:hypothetical protein